METSVLGVEESASLLGCHPNSIRRWANKGELRYFRDRRGWRKFKAEDLLKLKEELQRENWPTAQNLGATKEGGTP
jgi:excisionase family DNA binding protein